MSFRTKLFCLLIGGFYGYWAQASIPSISDQLYSDSLYAEKTKAVPGALESSGREEQLAAIDTKDTVKTSMASADATEANTDQAPADEAPVKTKKHKKHKKKK